MSVPSYVFSRDPAWMQTTRSGFRQQELEIIISNQTNSYNTMPWLSNYRTTKIG